MGQLDGRVAIVTGASRGIGKEIATLFAAEGAKVAVVARTEKDGDHPLPGGISDTVEAIRSAGGDATAVRCDISQFEELEGLVAAARGAYGPVDVLVNNAAITFAMAIEEMPLRRWQKMLDADLTAPMLLSKLVIPDMAAKGRGNIVNVSSIAAQHPQGREPGAPRWYNTTYGTVKAGLERFTTGLASEVDEKNIAVNALSPTGIVPTPGVLHHRLVKDENDPRAEPTAYMAKAALILAACDASKLTGRITYSQELLKEYGQLP
jgi:NAD(P)-dependent dehydrogenase (short-subunit alcohol dehydrogenase family)